MNARQLKVARRLAEMASGQDIAYQPSLEGEVRKAGAFTYYEVEAKRLSNGETWQYWLAADCGSYRGSFGGIW